MEKGKNGCASHPWPISHNRNRLKRLLRRRRRTNNLRSPSNVRPSGSWLRKGQNCKNDIIRNVMSLGPVLTPLPIYWVGMSTLGLSRTHMKHQNGLMISGAPALWTTNSWQPNGLLMGLGWSLLADPSEHLHVSACPSHSGGIQPQSQPQHV